jgi:hypothetical protein
VLLRGEAESHALAIWQRQEDPLTIGKSAEHASRLATGQRHVGLQIDVPEGQPPTLAEAARNRARQRIVAACEGQIVAADGKHEVGLRAQQLRLLARRIDLDRDARFAASAGQVDDPQAQRIKAIGQAARVELRESGGIDRAVAAGQQGVVFLSVTGDFQGPRVDVVVAGAADQRRRRSDPGKRQLTGEGRRRRALVERIADADDRRAAADETVYIGGLGAQGDLADRGGGQQRSSILVERTSTPSA